MRVVLIFTLLFSAAMCGLVPSWLSNLVRHQPDNESDLKERASHWSTIPAPVVSTTAQMLVRFTTDSTTVDKGFFATYVGVWKM